MIGAFWMVASCLLYVHVHEHVPLLWYHYYIVIGEDCEPSPGWACCTQDCKIAGQCASGKYENCLLWDWGTYLFGRLKEFVKVNESQDEQPIA